LLPSPFPAWVAQLRAEHLCRRTANATWDSLFAHVSFRSFRDCSKCASECHARR
jgi:hypothetical protein